MDYTRGFARFRPFQNPSRVRNCPAGSDITCGPSLASLALQAKENEEYIYLSSKDGDLRSMDATKTIFEKYKPTHVIHLAARVSLLLYVLLCWCHNKEYHTRTRHTTNVPQAALYAGCQLFRDKMREKSRKSAEDGQK